eukprot:Gb_31260 [translate_table: standard]
MSNDLLCSLIIDGYRARLLQLPIKVLELLFHFLIVHPFHSSLQDKILLSDQENNAYLFGCLQIPKYNYMEIYSEFHFWSCLTRPEVISSTARLKAECNKVLKLTLLNTHYSKSFRLEDFEQLQSQTIEQASMQLKDRCWTTTLRNIIRSSFKDVGKGWFNLKENSFEAFEASKMKRFLRMVRYMMEDSVRFLVEDTLERYCSFIERHCGSPEVNIEDIDLVTTKWPPFDHKIIKKPPLFSLEISNTEQGVFYYNTPLENFEVVALKAFDNAVTSVQSISELGPSVMENLFWSQTPKIDAVQLSEPKIKNLKSNVQVGIRKAMDIARAYLDKFSVFEPILKLDVAKYKADLETRKPPLKELLIEVRGHRSDQDNLEKRSV